MQQFLEVSFGSSSQKYVVLITEYQVSFSGATEQSLVVTRPGVPLPPIFIFIFFLSRMKKKYYSWDECLNLREVKVSYF